MARKAVLSALALILILAVPAFAQQKAAKKPASATSAAAEAAGPRSMTNFGQRWTAMSDKERDIFLEGMLTTIRIVCLNAVMNLDANKGNVQEADKNFRECMSTYFPYRPYEVKQAMTAIYQDKANNILPFDLVFGQSLLKVKGDPIDDNLVKLRQDLAKRSK